MRVSGLGLWAAGNLVPRFDRLCEWESSGTERVGVDCEFPTALPYAPFHPYDSEAYALGFDLRQPSL